MEPKPSLSGVENAQPFSPMRALSLLSTLQSADIVLPTTDGAAKVEPSRSSQIQPGM